MTRVGGQVVWSPTLRRNLKDNEESQFISLLNLLNDMFIPERGEDARVWTTSKDGTFFVSSFFSAISNSSRERSVLRSIWKLKPHPPPHPHPPRVVLFGWLVLRRRILTMDFLKRRGITVVNGYPICLRQEESMDHLILNCKVAVFLEVRAWVV
eukprot:TRINITY_DN9599_c0_g4_i1.p1 TRINITY_DN9599_c0_g4~~TRINITY_DN9599_c0_g4_i1.p1  ORF type:complete len:154 (-),score=18.03 TRINITY_DN9599_c0_g4_i1:181-642(-)